MNATPLIWLLLDDRPGTANQALAVVESLKMPFDAKAMKYSRLADLPNCALDMAQIFSKNCVAVVNRDIIAPPWPDLIISAGRRAAFVASWIKRVHAPNAKIAQIMDPNWRLNDFDILAIPAHDDFAGVHSGVVRTLGNPHRMTAEKLAAAKQRWQLEFINLPSPKIGVLIGGVSKGKGLNERAAIRFLQKINLIAQTQNASLLISTSRRTPQNILRNLSEWIKVPHYAYNWRDGGDNPYAGILACADAVAVTGDSTSMIAESCATGKPVYIFAEPGMVAPKHARLHADMIAGGYAHWLGDRIAFDATAPSVAAADQIAAQIRILMAL